MELKLTDELWEDSQKNELYFWKKQFEEDNLDQKQRNAYYLSRMEGQCSLIKDFVESNDLSDKAIIDLGSGPEGILHVLEGRRKIAVDPLMVDFQLLGYNVSNNRVIPYSMKAEVISSWFKDIDVVFCLNSIDHHQDPQLVVDQIYQVLKPEGDLILLTDTRLPEECDAYHKLPLTTSAVDGWLENFRIITKQVFPHGEGNPIMQYIVHAKKK